MTLASPVPPPHDAASTPRVLAAFAVSLVAHAVLAALLLMAGDGRPVEPVAAFHGATLRATIARPHATFAVPEAVAPPQQAPSRAEPRGVAPLPLRSPPLRPQETVEPISGRVAVLPDDGAPVDPSIEAAIAAAHPGLARGVAQFDVEPLARYPERARDSRRQVFLRVPVVVRDDGTMHVAEGTFEDPVFGDAIAEALASARVRVAPDDAAHRPVWTVLTFYFEHYGAGESQRTLHEAK
ncbi:MAG TPA: hypothetical protein VFX05_19480 [Casimicrobiaceae bacterium]|nr:hypothetical protein [Casimicrobiaceae bacterium]